MDKKMDRFMGLDNTGDPLTLPLGHLATADNIDITDAGKITRRKGYDLAIAGNVTGAYGTLDEFFETLTLIQTGRMERIPLLLFGMEFWRKVINFEALADAAMPGVGANLRQYGHVRLFSPWQYNVDPAMARLLAPTGWQAPPADGLPLAREIVERVLAPFAQLPQVSAALHLAMGE